MWEVRTQDRSGVQPAPTLTTSFITPSSRIYKSVALVSMGMRLILNLDDGGGVGV